MKNAVFSISILVLAGCGGAQGAPAQEQHASSDEAAAPEPTRVLDDGSRLFGAEMDEAREVTPLADILGTPDRFSGQVVKTEGEIAAVCQSMGCWMEIRANAESPGVRVPMAGHSFFLPRDLSGQRATIEGTVQVAALSEEDRAHLESEGATAADQSVSIEATAVLVHP
jgi:hypothetical protein